MRVTLMFGRLRADATARRGDTQLTTDLTLTGAARPRKVILRACLDFDHGFGTKRGRMADGWHVAQVVGPWRLVALAYRPPTGVPHSDRERHAPAYAWWPTAVQRRFWADTKEDR